MTKKFFFLSAVPAAAVMLGSFLAGAQAQDAKKQTAVQEMIPVSQRKIAQDFHLTDVEGRQLQLSKYRGRVVLLDFWAVNCGGCKQEIPWYVDFDAHYRKFGLSLIGLDMYGESPEMIRTFMQRAKMQYPVAVGTDALGEQYGLKEMPLTLLIDRRGRIAVSHAGVVDRAAFESDIRTLLAE